MPSYGASAVATGITMLSILSDPASRATPRACIAAAAASPGSLMVGPGVTEAQTWRAWLPQPVLRHREGHVLAGVVRRRA